MKEFIKKIISSESGVSSKRFNGTIGFAIFCFLVIFIVSLDIINDYKLEQTSVTLLNTLSYTSGLLLGIGILDKHKLK